MIDKKENTSSLFRRVKNITFETSDGSEITYELKKENGNNEKIPIFFELEDGTIMSLAPGASVGCNQQWMQIGIGKDSTNTPCATLGGSVASSMRTNSCTRAATDANTRAQRLCNGLSGCTTLTVVTAPVCDNNWINADNTARGCDTSVTSSGHYQCGPP